MDNAPYIPAKHIIYKTKSPGEWFGLDYNMNIYRGCCHGCIYCDSRSDCYKNTDFDTVKIKENALQTMRDDLRRKVKTGVIGTGAMSDPYNPLERERKLTRNSLELINAFNFGVGITTKSDLITRDIDILQDIKSHSPVIAKITITTADKELCADIEPNVATATERFDTLSALADAEIFCGVLMIPILPYINDTEENIINILRQAKEAGAKFVYTYMGMTLRQGNREYFYNQLDKFLPQVKEKYIKRFGLRYNCYPPNIKKLWSVYTTECERLGLLYDMKAIIGHYKSGYGDRQLSL